MDPSQGCSSLRPEHRSFPVPALRAGVWEQGRAEVSEGGRGVVDTPSPFLRMCLLHQAPSCGCGCASRPRACGWGGGFPVVPMPRGRDSTQDNTPQPPQPPESLPEHPGHGAESTPAQGLCKTSNQALTILLLCWGVSHCGGISGHPGPLPGHARTVPGGVAALAPGLPSLLLSGRAQLLRGAEPGAPAGQEAPLWGAAHTLPPSPGVPAAPSLRWPHCRRDVPSPGALVTAAAFPAPSLPRPAGGAGGGWPTTPRGCQGCPRR